MRLGILKYPRIGGGTFRSLSAGVAGARGSRSGQRVRATGRVPAARSPWSPGVYGAGHALPNGGQKGFPRGLGGPGTGSTGWLGHAGLPETPRRASRGGGTARVRGRGEAGLPVGFAGSEGRLGSALRGPRAGGRSASSHPESAESGWGGSRWGRPEGQGRKAGSPERTAGCDPRLPATCLSAVGAQ